MGQGDVQATWCAAQDLPSNVIEEYNQEMQPHTELLSINYSGQATITAVVTTTASSCDKPQKKKLRTSHLDSATEGYNLMHNILILHHTYAHTVLYYSI